MYHILTIITTILLFRSTITQKSWSSQLPNDPFHSNDWIPLPSATFQQQVIQPNIPGRQSSGRSIHFGSENSQQYTGPQIFPGHNVDQQQRSLFTDKSPDIITKPPTLDTGGEGRSILVTSNFHFGTNVQSPQQQSSHVPARENVIQQQPAFIENQFYQPLNPLAFQQFSQQPLQQQQQPQLIHTQQPAAVIEEPQKPQGFNPFTFQQPMQPGPSVIPQQQEEVQLLYVPLDTLWQHKLQQQPQLQQQQHQQQQQQQTLHQRPVQSTRNFIDPVQINNFYTPQPYTTTTTRKTTTTTTTPSPTVFHRFSMTPKPQYFSSSKPHSQQFSQSPNVYTTQSPLYHQSSASPRFIQTTSQPSLGLSSIGNNNNYYNQPSQHLTTTPTSQPKKSHQPPLSMFVRNGLSSSDISVADVLSTLRNLNSVDVLDSPGKKSPKVFIGPSNLFTPNGYSKFSLPYLSSIEHSPRSSNGSLQHIPFFVAPQSYRAPKGFAKIPLPAPHIGSFVHSATDDFGIEKTTRQPINRPNVEVNIGSTRYSSIPTEQQPSYTQSYRGLSSSTTAAPANGLFNFKENSEKIVRPKAEKSIRFRNNQNSFQPPSHLQSEEYFSVKSTVPNYISSTTTDTSISENVNPSSTLSYTRNPYSSPNFFHYDSYNNNSNVPALRLQNYNPVAQSERTVEFRPSPKSEHDQPDVFRPMTEQPPSPSPQEEYEMKNYFRGQTDFRTPFNDISSTPSYNSRVSSTESNELKNYDSPTYTESNYISEIIPEVTTKKIVNFSNEQDTFPLNHNEVYRVRNVTRSSRPISRFRYQYSSEAPAVEQQQTTTKNKETTENRNYADNQYATNFASILSPIMNYFTSDGSNEEKSEITTTSAAPSIVKEYSAESDELPKELPAISARLPGMINNLLEEELALDQLGGSSSTESYTTTTQPTTSSSIIRRRPSGRRTVPIRTTTPSSERSVTRQTTARGRRTYGQTTSSPNDVTVTKTRNSPIRSRNVTAINRGSTRARGIVKAKDKKEENWEYQRDELNQNYPSTRVRKVTSNRSEVTTTTTTSIPTTIIPSQIITSTPSTIDTNISNLSNDFLNGVPLQIPEKYQSANQIPKNNPVYEAQRTTMKAQSLNNELFENTPKPLTRRYNFANRAARPTIAVETASVLPVEITERIDTTQWNDNYVGLDTNQPEISTDQPKRMKTRNKRIRKPSSARASTTTTTESSNIRRFTNDDIHRQINQFNAGFYSETPQQPTRSSIHKYSSNDKHPYSSKYFSTATEDSISTAAIYSSNKRHDNSIIDTDSTDSPPPTTTPTNRRRGVWKRIRVRPIDVLETAESQYIEKTNFSPKTNDSNNNLNKTVQDKFEDTQIYTNQVLDTSDHLSDETDYNYESQKLIDIPQLNDDNKEDYNKIETTTMKDESEYSTINMEDHDITTTTNDEIKIDDVTEEATTIETKDEIVMTTTSTENPEPQMTTIHQINLDKHFEDENDENLESEHNRKDDMDIEASKKEEILQTSDLVIESPSTTINYESYEPAVLTTEQAKKYAYNNNDEYDEEMVTEESEIHQMLNNNEDDNDEVETEDVEDDENEQSNLIATSIDESPTKQYMTIKRQKPPTDDSTNNAEGSDNSTPNLSQPNDAIAFHKNLMKSVIYATSTSTRVTHDTEICYRGRCIRTDKKS